MTTRVRECNEKIAAGCFRKARQFLDGAETIREFADDEAEVGDAFVTLCVHAGIAAADTICCEALGHHAQGDDHAQAIAEFGEGETERRGARQRSATAPADEASGRLDSGYRRAAQARLAPRRAVG